MRNPIPNNGETRRFIDYYLHERGEAIDAASRIVASQTGSAGATRVLTKELRVAERRSSLISADGNLATKETSTRAYRLIRR
jgi:hypothetical protein